VDEVEAFLAEQPRLGKVIDLETQIWWDERWLGRAEISPKYLGQLVELTSADGCLSAKSLRSG
jgi:hypothetical protein